MGSAGSGLHGSLLLIVVKDRPGAAHNHNAQDLVLRTEEEVVFLPGVPRGSSLPSGSLTYYLYTSYDVSLDSPVSPLCLEFFASAHTRLKHHLSPSSSTALVLYPGWEDADLISVCFPSELSVPRGQNPGPETFRVLLILRAGDR